MSNLVKKFFKVTAIGCILINFAISHLKAYEITPEHFKPWLVQLEYIRKQYSDRGAVSIINFMIERLTEIVDGKSKYTKNSESATIERQLYKILVLPIIVFEYFYDEYKKIDHFPEQARKNPNTCKICLGKGTDGKYWCFLFENNSLVIRDYD